MLIILYQFIFYAFLILCYTSLDSVSCLLHHFNMYNLIQGSLDHLYISSVLGYLLCIYCVSMYI